MYLFSYPLRGRSFFHNLFVPGCPNSFSFGQGFFNHRNGNVAWKLQRRSLPCGKNIILDLFFSEIFHGPPSTTWYFYHGQRNTVPHIRSFRKIWLRWLLFFLSLPHAPVILTNHPLSGSPFYCAFPLASCSVNVKNRIWLTREGNRNFQRIHGGVQIDTFRVKTPARI